MSKQPINLLFNRAGTMMLRRRLANGALTVDDTEIYVTNKRIVKSVGISTSKETSPIESGNSPYPVDERTTKAGAKIKVTFNAFDRALFRFGAGMTKVEKTENAFITLMAQEYIVPETSYEIKMPYTIKSDGIMIIKNYNDGTAFAKASGATPSANEFAYVSAGNKFKFNEADVGAKVIVTYDALTSATSEDILSATPVNWNYEATFGGEISNLKGADGEIVDCVTFDTVKFTGDMTQPDKQLQAGDWSIELEAQEPTGSQLLSMKYANKSDLTTYTE